MPKIAMQNKPARKRQETKKQALERLFQQPTLPIKDLPKRTLAEGQVEREAFFAKAWAQHHARVAREKKVAESNRGV